MRFPLTILLAAAAVTAAPALEIEVTPGALAASLPLLENTRDASLTLTGEADVRDLALLRSLPPYIRTLDMSGLAVTAYTYATGDYYGQKSFEADALPAYTLCGARMTEVKLPAGLKVLGEGAAAGSAIASLQLPVTLERIGDGAFSNCQSLTAVTFPSALELGSDVFKDCRSLATVSFGYEPLVIPDGLFDGCTRLVSVVPPSVNVVGARAWRGTSVTRLDLTHVSEVGDYAFADMKSLSEIVFDSGKTVTLGNGVFLNDSSLAEAPQWQGVAGAAIASHTSGALTKVIDMRTVPAGCYANNPDIDSIQFGPSVREIGDHAFRNATALTGVNVAALGAAMPDVSATAFSGLENNEGGYDVNLYVAGDTQSTWKAHPVWGLFRVGAAETGVEDMVVAESRVNVKRAGSTIEIVAGASMDSVQVYGLTGVLLAESAPRDTRCVVSGLAEGEVLLVKVSCAGKTHIVKVI